MANEAVFERKALDGRLGEQYEVVENGLKVIVRAIAPPMIIKTFLATRSQQGASSNRQSSNRLSE